MTYQVIDLSTNEVCETIKVDCDSEAIAKARKEFKDEKHTLYLRDVEHMRFVEFV
jgi:hypothetical protein